MKIDELLLDLGGYSGSAVKSIWSKNIASFQYGQVCHKKYGLMLITLYMCHHELTETLPDSLSYSLFKRVF